jgi:RNA polymerase sigma factor (sigma-70 family)
MSTSESSDQELLREFLLRHREAAFTELARRHLNLVYSAALRQLAGDSQTAEDVVQMVFAELARQAKTLVKHPALAGWLYTTTRRMAGHARRGQQRREQREQEAFAMQNPNPTDESADWLQLRDVLDEAMHQLSEKDRLALLSRFFEGRELRQVGETLGTSENAARMRVQRALEKLRGILARKGVTTSAAGLTAVLGANTVTAAPAALLASVTSATTVALNTTGAASLGGLTAKTLFIAMKTPIVYTAAIILASAPLVFQQLQIRPARAELADLRHGLADQDDLRARAAQAETNRQAQEELAILKRDEAELGRLKQETESLKAKNTNSIQLSQANRELRQAQTNRDREAAEVQAQVLRDKSINNLKQMGWAALVWAQENKGRFPKTFEAMALELGQGFMSKGLTERFEFFPQGRELTPKDTSRFLFREINPRQMPNGQWERAYCLGDGSVHNITLDTDDFTAWEQQAKGIVDQETSASSSHSTGGQ